MSHRLSLAIAGATTITEIIDRIDMYKTCLPNEGETLPTWINGATTTGLIAALQSCLSIAGDESDRINLQADAGQADR